jgi:hypothetical protein
MNRTLLAARAAVGLCLLVAGGALADGTVQERQTAVKLYRGSSIIAASDPKSSVFVDEFTPAACEAMREARWQEEAATRTSGTATYRCQVEERATIAFHPAPVQTCGDKPADLQEPRACPAGTVGTWLQDRVYTLRPYPECWVLGDWTPSAPPAGMCSPVDSDGDGVPDSADQCPNVYAQTLNGCPASPSLLPAPTNVRAEGISTSAIRVSWNAVTGAAAYSIERCIGATCTGFSQLICVTTTSRTHTSLPVNLTARYRVRASRDAGCGTATGNLGAYSAIVSGTTLSATPTPVNCAVSAWSPYAAGAWSACSNGQQSRTETRSRTITTQPANGGTACPVLTETRTVTQACTTTPSGTASLSWTPSTRNTDGTPLTDLAGYRIHYGRNGSTPYTIQLTNSQATSYTLTGITAGEWHFCVRAFTTDGRESACSNVVYRTVR